jgi:hypothetical protein
MRLPLTLTLVFLLMVFSLEGRSGEKWTPELRKEAEATFERLWHRKTNTELDSLIQRLEHIANGDPDNQELHYYLGCAYDKRNADAERSLLGSSYSATALASTQYRRVIAINSRYMGNVLLIGPYSKLSSTWGGLAMRFLIQGNMDSARFAFKQGRDAGGFRDGILDYNRNMLVSCEKDAILFTNGDSDTFPALYVQVMEGLRRDVTIINLSLLNVPRYIAHMKSPSVYSFASSVPISLTDRQIGDLKWIPWKTRTLELPVTRDAETRYRATGANAVKNGRIRFSMPATRVVDSTQMIRIQDIMVRNIVFTNKWKRPIAFSATDAPDSKIGLDDYLWFNGLVLQLEPCRIEKNGFGLHEELLSALLMGNPDGSPGSPEPRYRLKSIADPEFSYDDEAVRSVVNYRIGFIQLALFYMNVRSDMQKGIAVLNRMDEIVPRKTFPMGWELLSDLAMVYNKAGKKEQFEEYARDVEPIAWNMIENGDLRMQNYYNPFRVLLDIYEVRHDFAKQLDLFLLLQKEYPKDKRLPERIAVLRAQLGKHDPAASNTGRK